MDNLFFAEPYDLQSPLDTPKIVEMVNNWESPFDSNSSLFSSEPSSNVNYGSQQQQQFMQGQQDQPVLSPKLESSSINLDYLNSPEMTPVSPNKVCPEYTYPYDYPSPVQVQQSQQEVPYKVESVDSLTYCQNTFLTNSPMSSTYQPQQLSMPQSPASISSNYSLDNANTPKTFTCLDSVPLPVDTYTDPLEHLYHSQDTTLVPTMVDDMSNFSSSVSSPSPANVVIKSEPCYDTASLYPATTTTTAAAVYNPTPIAVTPIKPMPNKRPFRPQQQTVSRVQATGGITKKSRMTKREKQKQMENTIEKFTQENRDLSLQIDLLEKQICFCKNYLSKHVAPVVQKVVQQDYQHQYMFTMVKAN